jgi:hypothetical protein
MVEGVQGFVRSHWMTSSGIVSSIVSPRQTTGSHAKKNDKKAPYLLASSMAVVVCWYDTKRIA